jgi:hypothetical protein
VAICKECAPHWKVTIASRLSQEKEEKLMANILHVTHINNEKRLCELILDLDVITVYGLASSVRDEYRIIHWTLDREDKDNGTHVTDSMASLKERIWGVKE